ncbi:MAG: SAM-dependent chlorinase/fluorinase [Dehalococcoidia bacterium]|nr:SAM-dependent chlorinase/fluorinase [Dehalococcoidia bacterium]MDD5493239.1 SAM-dependent chlorinase/fluorinase [Dehalococcoidia bacterium]
MLRIITLTTDFGAIDGYVASMKGVILNINPQAVIVDLSHSIEPQFVRQASFILHTSWRFFPEGSIHIAVVDPGVGSHRKAVILKTPSAYFVGPDNGIFSYVLHELAQTHVSQNVPSTTDLKKRLLPEGCEAVALSNQEFWRHPVSSTFHGRDIFAPAAAHLSMDVSLSEFGESLDSLFAFPIPEPFTDPAGNVVGCIVHIDRFGNLITNFKKEHVPPKGAAVEIRNQRISSMNRIYAEGGGLQALIGSNDYLEISIKDGNAASLLGATVGDTLKLLNAANL